MLSNLDNWGKERAGKGGGDALYFRSSSASVNMVWDVDLDDYCIVSCAVQLKFVLTTKAEGQDIPS